MSDLISRAEVPDTNVGDLISREALRRAMYHEAMEKDSDEQKWDSGCWIRYKMFERVLEAQPPAQRRGKWVKGDKMPSYPRVPPFRPWMYYCSECESETGQDDNALYDYCPYCGARMEADEP